MPRNLLPLLITTVTAALLPTLAHGIDPLPADTKGDLWLDGSTRLGYLPTDGRDVVVFTARASALIPVRKDGALALRAGVALADIEGESQAVTSNFFLGYAWSLTPELRFTPALVFPSAALVSSDDSGLEKLFTHLVTLQAFSLHEFWMHAPETISIVMPLRADYEISTNVHFEVNAALALVFLSLSHVVSRDDEDDEVELFFDTEMGVVFSVVRVGLGVVFVPTIETDEARVSTSIGLSVPIGRERQARFHAAFHVQLDKPALFDEGAAPSLSLGYTTPL